MRFGVNSTMEHLLTLNQAPHLPCRRNGFGGGFSEIMDLKKYCSVPDENIKVGVKEERYRNRGIIRIQ